MSKRASPSFARKRRTRAHVLADLSVNHVERHVLRGGHTLERIIHDYGVDLLLFTYDQSGEVENGEIRIQVKATESTRRLTRGDVVACRLEQKDVRFWLNELMPVILVVYDALEDQAYWLYVQAYFAALREFRFGQTVTVYVHRENVFSEAAVAKFRELRREVMRQIEEGQL